MANENKHASAAKQRISTVRLRTWTLTLAILVSLAFYLVVNVATKQEMNPVDFVLLCIMQIIVHCLYFPDGNLFGQKDATFISNKNAYNEKASRVNEKKEIAKLREFCEYEYQERKARYIVNKCGIIGITLDEFDLLKQKSEKEIKKLETFEIKEIVDGKEVSRILSFSKHKRKILYDLIFKPLPVEKNNLETIMSAVESDGSKAIKDTSISYKCFSYSAKAVKAIVIGAFFAYVGYTWKDGIGIEQIAQLCTYITTLFTACVMSFSSGETCSKVYKSHFYLELANFIDEFSEWNALHNAPESKLISFNENAVKQENLA